MNRNIEEIIHLEEVANEADDAEDYSTAFENYRILAEKYENSNAQYLLGFYYQEGLGTAQNIFAAERWFRRSAAQGNQVALDALGGIYYSGEIGFTDYKKAFKYFKKAACRELPEVYEKLGHCYRLGHGVRVNKKRAFENYSRFYEADPNLDRAKLYMGLCFCDGIGVAADYDKGIAYLSEMDKIDPEAQYVLGKCLLGKGDAYGAAKALLCADAADLEVEPYLDQALDRLSEAQLDALFKECDSVKAGDDADDDYDDTDDSDDVDDDDDDDDDDDTDSGSRRHQSYSLGSKAYSNDITFSV